MEQNADSDVVGVLLAGGLSRRFGGGDKALNALDGKSVLQHVRDRARPQVGAMILNAGGSAARFDGLGLDVVEDAVPGALGPLAGVLTGMEWASANAPDAQWVATFATDAPFLPLDLVARLKEAALDRAADIAVAQSGGRVHPVFGLWRIGLLADLRNALVEEGQRKVMAWVEGHAFCAVEFSHRPIDPFFNINTPEDLDRARAMAPKVLSEGR